MSNWVDFGKLHGQRILSVRHTRETITVVTSSGTLELKAYGDCCSDSWFEHVDDDGVTGGEITLIEFARDPSKPEVHEEDADHYVKFYAGTIHTTKGRVCFEMRNRSNGYYSGELEASFSEIER